MGRAKKHITKFSWSEGQKKFSDKYKGKWVEGPKGKFWISSVFPGLKGFDTTAYGNESRNGYGLRLSVSELEEAYTIIDKPGVTGYLL